jgi:hypothetical protein
VTAVALGVAGAVRAEYTVTNVDDAEVAISGISALSVTCRSKESVCPAATVFEATEHVSVSPRAAPLPLFTVHCVAFANAPPLIETSHCHE